jgi:hypothetical protein
MKEILVATKKEKGIRELLEHTKSIVIYLQYNSFSFMEIKEGIGELLKML